ncbi:PaaI family thioesterase [Virgibacillus sp. YIM 98842]|uniref:PaaI family thioesterase n=1 Tax=Virgibacillus sp. YIM 98842 TaxID=2663533 RepID=UPI0013DA2A7B|nr:PaaI family thioesterase [Virgibacillus sp. YIM 98842]
MDYNPYWKLIGLKEVKLEKGKSVLELPVIHEITQSRNTVHGGVIASLVDAAVGAALRSRVEKGKGGVTVDLKVNYLQPAAGEKLFAKGHIVKKGKTIVVGEAVIENDVGEKVAIGLATYMMKKR